MPVVYSHYRSADFNLVEHLGLEKKTKMSNKTAGGTAWGKTGHASLQWFGLVSPELFL